MCAVGNLCISEPSLGILEKFQHSSALTNIKYNCVVLFWVNCIGYLFMLQNIFSYRPPLYDLFNKAELCALHPPCVKAVAIKGKDIELRLLLFNTSTLLSFTATKLFFKFVNHLMKTVHATRSISLKALWPLHFFNRLWYSL